MRKSNKIAKEILLRYMDKIKTDWEILSYEDIRIRIYKDCHVEMSVPFISSVCRELGVDRTEAKKANRRKKYMHWYY